MRLAQIVYAQASLSATQHLPQMCVREDYKETIMALIPPRPILAEDPLTYFVPLVPPAPRRQRVAPPQSALEQMYGYYTPDQA